MIFSFDQSPTKTSLPCLFSPLRLSICQRPYLSLLALVLLPLCTVRIPDVSDQQCGGPLVVDLQDPVSSMPFAGFGQQLQKSVSGQITESATRETGAKSKCQSQWRLQQTECSREQGRVTSSSIVGLLCKHFQTHLQLCFFFQPCFSRVRARMCAGDTKK